MSELKNKILNSIFYPRSSQLAKTVNDHTIMIENNICIGISFYIKNPNNHNLLFFHGNAELAQEYKEIGSIFNSYDINLIVADYRGYGLSTGEPTINNLKTDSLKIFEYVFTYLKDNNFTRNIKVMGRSLGSASAIHIASNVKYKISGCIIESGFATEYPLFNLLGYDYKSIGFLLSDGFENLRKIKKYKKPLLVIHAENDHIVPYAEGEKLFKSSISKEKDLFKVINAHHNNIIMRMNNKYFELILNFIANSKQ
jgi:fermentation-respiration switch protein FrsA (DUF1100 family)|tara:strand:+ start:2301 stop:3065 length:765 start_codon:yes stop_codon:yes gene_type:complete